ncbi:MAG: DoxX family membrane protein [Gammaproteobacteria bacterium]|jgi:thiosulfate dehydrogenase [quinone] large subunit|nr:MAG: DoxX family membrane protein [Gammaproteobacteria bacterium]
MNKKEFVTQIPEPALTRLLFADTRLAWVWLAVRLYVAWFWIEVGWKKVHDPMWVGDHAGGVIKGFITAALNKTGGPYPDVAPWYAFILKEFILPNATFFSYIVAWGELLVGVGLALGAFTGIAAFFGSLMNMSYLFAGTVSVNPIMALLQIFLILAWRVAGWFGLDRHLLPLVGTPWHPGKLFKK